MCTILLVNAPRVRWWMSQTLKLVTKIRNKPKDFTWSEAQRLMEGFGYKLEFGSGSRRKFVRGDGRRVSLHEPHPSKILKAYQIELILDHLEQEGLI